MSLPKYFIVELTQDVKKSYNSRQYIKGTRVMVWEDIGLNCYWTVNTNDNFNVECAKKLLKLEGKIL